MTEYSDLIKGVAIHVSPCPERVIVDSIRHVVRDFCKRTKVWVHESPEIHIEPDQLSYQLTFPENSAVFHLWGLNGRNGNYQTLQDVYLSSDMLVFTKQPSTSKSFKPLLSLMPTVESTSFPAHIYQLFEEHLISGTVAHLQLQPFREWSQPNAAQIHAIKYEQGILEANRLRDEGLNIQRSRNRTRAQYL